MRHLLAIILIAIPLTALADGVANYAGPIPHTVTLNDDNTSNSSPSSTYDDQLNRMVKVDCGDPDGCNLDFGEANPKDGNIVWVNASGTYSVTIDDQSGIVTIDGGSVTLSPSSNDGLIIQYKGDIWREIARPGSLADHDDLTGVSADDHHDEIHSHDNDGSGEVQHSALSGVTASQHHTRYSDADAETAINTDSDHGSTASHAHSDLSSVTSDQHHAQSHSHDGVDGSGTVSHNDLLSVNALDHHGVISSIVNTAGNLELDGDEASPGGANFYGTGGAGTKGWFPFAHTGLVVVTSSDHHVKYTDSDAVGAIDNDSSHGSDAPHTYTTDTRVDIQEDGGTITSDLTRINLTTNMNMSVASGVAEVWSDSGGSGGTGNSSSGELLWNNSGTVDGITGTSGNSGDAIGFGTLVADVVSANNNFGGLLHGSDETPAQSGYNFWVDNSGNLTFGIHDGTSAITEEILLHNPPDYTPSNDTTDRTFDADSTSTAELADVLATLIRDLQAQGKID